MGHHRAALGETLAARSSAPLGARSGLGRDRRATAARARALPRGGSSPRRPRARRRVSRRRRRRQRAVRAAPPGIRRRRRGPAVRPRRRVAALGRARRRGAAHAAPDERRGPRAAGVLRAHGRHVLHALAVPRASTPAPLAVDPAHAPVEPATARAARLGLAAMLPSGFDAWFARCVARDPAARYRTADEALGALDAVLSAGISRRVSVPRPATRDPRAAPQRAARRTRGRAARFSDSRGAHVARAHLAVGARRRPSRPGARLARGASRAGRTAPAERGSRGLLPRHRRALVADRLRRRRVGRPAERRPHAVRAPT